jgi:hypothetical protein
MIRQDGFIHHGERPVAADRACACPILKHDACAVGPERPHGAKMQDNRESGRSFKF